MALDTGPMGSTFDGADIATGVDAYSRAQPDAEPVTVESLVFAPGQTLGEGLRAAREFLGLDLQSVADATKIRGQYLSALEAMDLGQLPSRPFILGYVRAYARVLEVDEEQAIARFRQDAPDPDEPLRAPVGVPKTADPRFGLLGAAAGIVIAAIVVWNVAQRAMAEHDPNPNKGAVAMVADPAGGPVRIGEALPPPQESTLPDPYITPGLAPEVTGVEAPPVNQGPLRPPAEPRRFTAKGPVHGAPETQSQIIFQAQRSVSLVARGADGKVYFAQQLKGGEAYRAPMLSGLLIDVSSPDAMEVYVGGALAGTLTQPVTPLATIAKVAPPPPPPAPVAAAPVAAAPAVAQQQSAAPIAPTATPAPRPVAKPAATPPAARPSRQRTYARVPQTTAAPAPAPATTGPAPSALAPAG